jgi:MFS family permease
VVLGAGAMALVFGGAGTLGWILGSAILGYVASMATQRRRTMPVFVASSALYWMSSFAIPVPLPLLLILYTAAETAWTKYKKIPPEVHGGAEEHH